VTGRSVRVVLATGAASDLRAGIDAGQPVRGNVADPRGAPPCSAARTAAKIAPARAFSRFRLTRGLRA
jgi:hypothetical protein